MDNSNPKHYMGLGKVLFDSSLCSLKAGDSRPHVEIYLSERITRIKADGTWPEAIINFSGLKEAGKYAVLSDNRDVKSPAEREKELDTVIPFFDYLKKQGLDHFSSVLNSKINFVSHHLAHANVAKFMSPFEECAILVMDGAGSKGSDVSELAGNEKQHEESTLYHFKNGNLKLIEKKWQEFSPSKNIPSRWYGQGLGSCYEMIAEYIFNSKRASGKVMGLAAFGAAKEYSSALELLGDLNWEKSFKGSSKKEWEESEHYELYENIAASIQRLFELELDKKTKEVRALLPDVKNLILVGGCALNCVSNEKLLRTNVFDQIYVPPNPGDEGIGLGCALNEFYKENTWQKFPIEKQHGYFGPLSSVPVDEELKDFFKEYKVTLCEKVEEVAAELLSTGKTIAWFQGRSESGPRALGNRSIISKIDNPGLKDYLNKEVKFRETFRPYGCSVLLEKAHEYFDCLEAYANPYMSFAVPIRAEFKERFKEVCHVDGTSRIQTVSKGQNQLYYKMIEAVGKRTGLYGVLNTSLNIMGEPILEGPKDAKNFFVNSNLNHLIIGNLLVEKVGSES